jgi:hypothetical protein
MKDALTKVGGDAAALQVVGHLPSVRRENGSIDVERTMERLPTLVAAGVTDFFAVLPMPREQSAAEDYLHGIVAPFRAAVGRSQHEGSG